MAWLHNHWVLLLVVALILGKLLRARYWTPLRKVPGPWLGSITRLWKLEKILCGDMEWTNIELHKQYGMLSLRALF